MSLACGVIYAGERYSQHTDIDWLVVGVLVFLLASVMPAIEGPGPGLGMTGSGDGDGESASGDSDGGDDA